MLDTLAYVVARASGFNPALSVITVALIYICFSYAEAMIEKLIWGERFLHWIDR